MADDKLKRAARALAKKDVASSEWMWNPAYHKGDAQPTWLDKFLHTAPPAPAGPPAEYKRPMLGIDAFNQTVPVNTNDEQGNPIAPAPREIKRETSPQGQFILEQAGIPRDEALEDSKPVYRGAPIRAEDLPEGSKFQTDPTAIYGRTDEVG